MSANDSRKQRKELEIFGDFVGATGLTVDELTIEARSPPEPDIRFKIRNGPVHAMELLSLASQEAMHQFGRSVIGKSTELVWCGDGIWTPSPGKMESVFDRKLAKTYQTDCPVDLLCYWEASFPDEVCIHRIKNKLEACGYGQFRAVWYLGEKGVATLVGRAPASVGGSS